jgi:hypothetical protein
LTGVAMCFMLLKHCLTVKYVTRSFAFVVTTKPMQHIALVSLEGCWHYKKEINFHHSATEDNPLLLGRPNFHQRSTKVKGFFITFVGQEVRQKLQKTTKSNLANRGHQFSCSVDQQTSFC